jgi:hypothetical protein
MITKQPLSNINFPKELTVKPLIELLSAPFRRVRRN